MKIFASVLALILFAGCATTPIPTGAARAVPQERILSDRYLSPGLGTGEVVVKRDKGLTGCAVTPTLYVDGEPVAKLRPGEKVTLNLPAGDHVLSAVTGIAGTAETRANVREGTKTAFRIGVDGGSALFIAPTAF